MTCKTTDAPYKVETPYDNLSHANKVLGGLVDKLPQAELNRVMIDKYHDDQRNRMAFKPPVAEVPPTPPQWNAADVKLLLDTVRLTAPYTPEQLVKIQTFIGLLVEIKGMS